MMFLKFSDKHFRGLFHAGDQAFHFLAGIIRGEACADATLYAQMLHERLGAMMPGPYGYAQLVEYHAHVVVVGSVQVE